MSHLTLEQRYTIAVLLQNGFSKTSIAKQIGRHTSVVTREIARNADGRNGVYQAELAERKYRKRLKEKPKHTTFTQEIRAYVEYQLSQKLSPEQVSGTAKRLGKPCVSHERIYQHVWKDKRQKGELYLHLRTQGKRYRKRGAQKDKRGIIRDRRDISERDPVVEKRERFGDLEIDTIIGKDHKGALITINDRATGMLKIRKTKGKDSGELAKNVVEMLKEWKPHLHTMTADNGKEFAEHATIANELGLSFFFARPYHSWERGSNENLNGLIRQYVPKKTDLSTLSDDFIRQIEHNLNNRPRKRFNFRSPIEMFNKLVAFVT